MPPLSQDRNTPMKDGELVPVGVAASTEIFAGAIVMANVNGYAVEGQAGDDLTYLGRAEEHVDNSGGANGDKTILVRRKKAFAFKNSGTDAVTQASIGKVCYVEDDETVAATDDTGSLSAAGIVLAIEDGLVWVE